MITLKINDRFKNRKIDFFNDVTIDLKYDSVADTFTLRYLYDPNNFEHKEFSCVGHYHLCTIEDNGEVIITGVILSIEFEDDNVQTMVVISGYSLPGVLEDCQMPVTDTDYPIQTEGLSLKQIAEKSLKSFGLKIVIDPQVLVDMNSPYVKTEADNMQTIKSYLSELAIQKNIIITNDQYGNIVFTRAVNTRPIYNFERALPITNAKLTFNGQGIHSHIWAIAQASIEGLNASQSAPLRNPYCPIVFRPHVIRQTSGDSNNTDQVARTSRAKELRNLQLNLDLDRWVLAGKIVRPGKTITIINPWIYLFNKTEFFIEEVQLKVDAKQKTAKLKCVLPEVYTFENPKYIFSGINLHYPNA